MLSNNRCMRSAALSRHTYIVINRNNIKVTYLAEKLQSMAKVLKKYTVRKNFSTAECE